MVCTIYTPYNTAELEGSKSQWVEKARLLDSRAGILQVAFTASHLDLKLVILKCIRLIARQASQVML